MGVIGEVADVAQNGITPALLVQGKGIFVKFPGSHTCSSRTWTTLTWWTQREHLLVLDLSHQRVERTLLARVSTGWVSMGLGLKASQHRGTRNPSPITTLTPTYRQPHGSPPWAAGSSGAPPKGGPNVWLPAGEALGRREAAGARQDPLPDMGMWPSRNFQLS